MILFTVLYFTSDYWCAPKLYVQILMEHFKCFRVAEEKGKIAKFVAVL